MKAEDARKLEWLPTVLAAVAFVVCFAAFVWQLFVYQRDVRRWSESDLKSRAELAASSLAEPIRTLDFKAIQKVADQLKADGLRLRITEGRFFVSEADGLNGFFDTCGEPYPADVPCIFKVARTDNFFVGVGRPAIQMLLPFLGALLVIVLAALVGVAGVLLFFFVTYRQRVKIRELAKLEKFRRDFIADVSHEIKTPLTGILGAVDLLDVGSEVPREMQTKLLGMVKGEAKRMNALVQGILSLARLEREEDVLHPAETDLAELVREAVEMVKPQAELQGVTISVSGTDASLVCKVDGQLVAQALSNIIVNAIRHSGSKEVFVSVSGSAGKCRIAIEDHGVGIPPEHHNRIFERFHRVDESRTGSTGGAGLGLAIVRQIVRLHGGTVALEPVSPSGCRFVIVLNR